MKTNVATSGGSSTGGGGDTPASRPTYTGHADAEGLRAIGWTDEDIAYYQEHGVNWNEEDDEYHKVPQETITLYPMFKSNGINSVSNYKDSIIYFPKISISNSNFSTFSDFKQMVAIPLLDFSHTEQHTQLFNNCYSLVCVPKWATNLNCPHSDMDISDSPILMKEYMAMTPMGDGKTVKVLIEEMGFVEITKEEFYAPY